MEQLQIIGENEREQQYLMAEEEGLHRDQPELSPLEELLRDAHIDIDQLDEINNSDSDDQSSENDE